MYKCQKICINHTNDSRLRENLGGKILHLDGLGAVKQNPCTNKGNIWQISPSHVQCVTPVEQITHFIDH